MTDKFPTSRCLRDRDGLSLTKTAVHPGVPIRFTASAGVATRNALQCMAYCYRLLDAMADCNDSKPNIN